MRKDWPYLPGSDFHLHSTASDGTRTPEELVDKVMVQKLRAFALTDHDTLAGIPAVERYLKEKRGEDETLPCFIPGVELSVHFDEQEIHLLAYFPDGNLSSMSVFLERQRRARVRRNLEILAKLEQMGFAIRREDIPASQDEEASWGRLHIAEALVRKGYFEKIGHAFHDVLSIGRPAYVDRQKVRLEEAVHEVKVGGGITIVAHPQKYGWCPDAETNLVNPILIRKCRALQRAGVDGIEAGHGDASINQRDQMLTAARAFNMLYTAGSDDHGTTTPHRAMYDQHTVIFPDQVMLVVCALVRDKNGRILLGRRAGDQTLPGFYEMPGGKVKDEETNEAALKREIKEELAVDSDIGRLHSLLWNKSSDRFIALAVYETTLDVKRIQLAVHDDLRFVNAAEALELNVLPADIAFLETLL